MSDSNENNEKKHRLRDAIFLDIPYILDSISRHADYQMNRLDRYEITDNGGSPPTARPYIALPPFWFFVMILLFCAYGPTLSAVCGVFGATVVGFLRDSISVLCFVGAVVLLIAEYWFIRKRIHKRFTKQNNTDVVRKRIVQALFYLVLLAPPYLVFQFGRYL